MVKASVMAGNRGGRISAPGEEIDYGLPLTHPALMIPIIGLIIMGSMALIACFCKCLPELVPDSCKLFGKRSADKDLELQLRRRTPHRPSVSPSPGRSPDQDRNHKHGNNGTRVPSFNSNDKSKNPHISQNGRNSKYPKANQQLPFDCYQPPPPYESLKLTKEELV